MRCTRPCKKKRQIETQWPPSALKISVKYSVLVDKEVIGEKHNILSSLELLRSVKPLLISQSPTALKGLAARARNQSLLQKASKSGKKQSRAGQRKEMDETRALKLKA